MPANVYHFEYGDSSKLPVLFTHAFPLTHSMWNPQIEALDVGYRVVAYDMRGFGRSDTGNGQYMLEFMVDDLFGLMDHLRIERAVLCGLSMGGYITLRAAERALDRVRALVLADTRSEADSTEAKVKRANAIKTVQKHGVAMFGENFVQTAFAPTTLTENAGLVEATALAIRGNSVTGVCGALVAMASRTDTTAFLPEIKVPTLILVGEHDALTPPAASRAMAEKIPGSELHVIPGAGHLSNLENAPAFNRHLTEFLTRIQ